MNSSWMLIVWAVTKVDSATWIVHDDESWAITSGHRNEFQLPMNVIAARAAKNGSEFGTTIRQNVPKWPAPSTRAASSSSRGKLRKYCRNRNAAKPLNSVGMIRPRNELTQPSDETTMKLGMNVTAPGIISVATTA